MRHYRVANPLCGRADRAPVAEYFQHRNIEELYLNNASWYAEQNPEHFAFHIGEQVR